MTIPSWAKIIIRIKMYSPPCKDIDMIYKYVYFTFYWNPKSGHLNRLFESSLRQGCMEDYDQAS